MGSIKDMIMKVDKSEVSLPFICYSSRQSNHLLPCCCCCCCCGGGGGGGLFCLSLTSDSQ